jgi:hypothetical protein
MRRSGRSLLLTEMASWDPAGLVKREPLVCQEITCQKLKVEAQLLDILGGINVPERWMWGTRQATQLHIQVIHLGISQ